MNPTHTQVLEALQDSWATYVERFRRLSPEEQACFLRRQGYVRFADLLAHVTAWWEDGIRTIRARLAYPRLPLKEYDVDAFNAQAVERVRERSEAEVIQSFEAARQELLDLLQSLPEEAFENERIAKRLYVGAVEHLEEHEIPVNP